ncbi:hypothetical protein ACQP25_44830 (plasmid) [Microtetraspora malaysiensis]|uniref:hypothetical protein n=1 Tax=Microtetraspora malaysiensis TaxID=161358 RepID=UPI003D8B5CF0
MPRHEDTPTLDGLDIPDPADPESGIRWLTDRYAAGTARQAWERDGTPMSAAAAMEAVLADPTPTKEAAIAALALRRQLAEEAERLDTAIVDMARGRGVWWETIGASVGVSKQAAEQRHVRRTDAARARRRAGKATAGGRLRAWLDQHANALRLAAVRVALAGRELRAVNVPVATAMYHLETAEGMYGDADVLARARDLVAAVADAEAQAGPHPWDQVRLSAPAREAVDDLAKLVAEAPD